MGLRDYEEPFEEVEIGKNRDGTPNVQRVRGLGFEDVCRLARSHAPLMAIMYKRFMDEKAIGFTAEGLSTLITAGMGEFPDAVAFIIGLASDDTDPETLETVRKLRLSVQVEFIQKIIGLTFMSESEIKKLIEIVTEMMAKTTGVLSMLNLPDETLSGSGNGAFVKT